MKLPYKKQKYGGFSKLPSMHTHTRNIRVMHPNSMATPVLWTLSDFILCIYSSSCSSVSFIMGFPGGASDKEPSCQRRRHGFDLWVGKIPWRWSQHPLIKWKKWKLLSHVRLFATPWTVLSMEFSRPEYWSG